MLWHLLPNTMYTAERNYFILARYMYIQNFENITILSWHIIFLVMFSQFSENAIYTMCVHFTLPYTVHIYWNIHICNMNVHTFGIHFLSHTQVIKAWFQIQWQLNCKQHFTFIYIVFDVFNHHSKMLKGRKLHLNITVWHLIRFNFITAVMHPPRTLVTPHLCLTCTCTSKWRTFIWEEVVLSFTQHTCLLCPLRSI